MISILSDFGLEDTYVAAMKAVISEIAPKENILDLTHEIPPGDILRGALELWRVAPVLPAESIILAVVDPGVGTERKALAIQTQKFMCVGPDNGLFSYLLGADGGESIVELKNKAYHRSPTSTTFHGRDIFAPAAAHLATGVAMTELGPSLDSVQKLPAPVIHQVDPNVLHGEIMYADRFGNLITSLGVIFREQSSLRIEPWAGDRVPIVIENSDPVLTLPDGMSLPLSDAFDDVKYDSLTAYIGSSGLLEIGVNGGNAMERTGLKRGDPIELRTRG